jgi:hypothetical protein
MQTQRLKEIMKAPHLVEAGDEAVLRALVERFPFATPLRMLLAKASAVGQHLSQRDDVLAAAAHLGDRRPLFELLVRPALLEEARKIHEELGESAPEFEQAPEVEQVSEVEPVPSLEETTSTDPETEEEMNRELLLQAIESSIGQDVEEWKKKESTEEERASNPMEDSDVDGASFGSWLQKRAQSVGYNRTAAPADEVPVVGVDALIDVFLQKAPTLGPMREVDDGIEALARESITPDESLVTETMARIYAMQGQIQRARKAYKLLALKFPAKSVYFASQLNMLNQHYASGRKRGLSTDQDNELED